MRKKQVKKLRKIAIAMAQVYPNTTIRAELKKLKSVHNSLPHNQK